MMKLGFVSAIWPDLTLKEVATFAAANGYDCIELMCWPKGKAERRYAGVTHVDVVGFTAERAKRVNETMKGVGVAISGLGYYPNPLAPDRAEAQVYVDHIRHVIQAAKLLGVGVMNTFVGRDWTKSVDDNWPAFSRNLAAAGQVRCRSRRQNRHRELPHVVYQRRMAGREEPHDLTAHLAPRL